MLISIWLSVLWFSHSNFETNFTILLIAFQVFFLRKVHEAVCRVKVQILGLYHDFVNRFVLLKQGNARVWAGAVRSQVFGEILFDVLINCLRNIQVFLQLFQGILFDVCHDAGNFLGPRVLQLFTNWVKVPSDLYLVLDGHEFELDEGV